MAGGSLLFLSASCYRAAQSLMAQQKGQYQPGQFGLNAGVLPDPGITYADINLNYNADQLNFANGTPVKVTGTYNVWVMENIFFYVPKFKILGAKYAPYVAFPTLATGSLTLPFLGNGTTVKTGGVGIGGYVVSTAKSWLAFAARRRLGGICFHGAHRASTLRAPRRMSVPVTGATTSTVPAPFT